MVEFQRPAIPYNPDQVLPSNNRYNLESAAGQPPTADDFDGDFNYLIDSCNSLYASIQGVAAGVLPGADVPGNINKFPITNGDAEDPVITWSNVTTAYIANLAVTAAKIANSTITNQQIANATIQTAQIFPGSITNNLLALNAVQNGNIVDGTIMGGKLAAETVTAAQIASNTITGDEIANQTITAVQIADSTITADQIVDNTITAAEIANNTLTAAQIANNTITAAQIANNTITNQQLAPVIQMPIGAIFPYAAPGVAAIPGWLFCNGQPVNRVTYAALFLAIGVSYGAGDGATTFNLPDLRGRSIAHLDMNNAGGNGATNGRITAATASALTVGGNGGFEQVTLDVTQIPNHSHSIGLGVVRAPIGARVASGNSSNAGNVNTENTGGGQAHNNMPPFIFMQALIYAGV